MVKKILSKLGLLGLIGAQKSLSILKKNLSKGGKTVAAAGSGLLLLLALSPVGKFLIGSFLAVVGKAVGLIPWWLPASLLGLYAMFFG